MESNRLPRFERASAVDPIDLTERDRQIVRLVCRHRFLRSSHIVSLVGGSSQQILRRLQLLYHNGYLERPRAQLDYYYKGGSREIVYGLGDKSSPLLPAGMESVLQLGSWSEKNRSVGRMYLEHALLISDVMVAIELACRKSPQIQLLNRDELLLPADIGRHGQSLRWKVEVRNGLKLGIVPDRVFALDCPGEDNQRTRAYFFLEADRGTMPVMRKDLSHTSFYRKLLAYQATWAQSLHRTHLGFDRFRVITITTRNNDRVESLVRCCSHFERGHGLFLFANQAALENLHELSSPIWKTGRHGELTGLLN